MLQVLLASAQTPDTVLIKRKSAKVVARSVLLHRSWVLPLPGCCSQLECFKAQGGGSPSCVFLAAAVVRVTRCSWGLLCLGAGSMGIYSSSQVLPEVFEALSLGLTP